jgi:iron complex outermembrane receptor protein
MKSNKKGSLVRRIARRQGNGWALRAAAAIGAASCASDLVVPAATAAEPALEEVVVTARYREESLQETPIAITALTAEALDVRGFDEVENIGATVPNAFIRPGNAAVGPAPTIGIRGVIQTDFNYAFEPGVAVYIDDIYHATLTGASLDLMDLERVEVLRGPQGTLFGKNTLGGAIRLVSKRPQGDNSGYLEASYGTFQRIDVKASYDFPLIEDRLFMRLAGVSKRRDGYQDQLDFRCQMIANGTPELAGIGDGRGADGPDPDPFPDAVTPGSAADNAFSFPSTLPGNRGGGCKIGTLGGENIHAGRAMLRFVASDRLEFNFTADYSNDSSEATPITSLYEDVGPLTTGVLNPLIVGPRWGIALDERFLPRNPYETYETFADPISGAVWPDTSAVETWGLANTVDYELADGVGAKFILGYRKLDSEFAAAGDGSPIKESVVYNVTQHEQWSAELQVSGTLLGDRLSWTAGGFYFDSETFLGGRVEFGALNFINAIPPFDNNDRFQSKNTSGFVHTVFNVTDLLSVTGGVRYTKEEKEYSFDHTGFFTIAEPAVSEASRFDWKVGLDYRLSDATLLYTQIATGFRSEGFNPRPWTPVQLLPIDGEELTSYEIGYKAELFDKRLRANVAAFYSDYTDRLIGVNATQCSAVNVYSEPYLGAGLGGICPPGTPLAGQQGFNWFVYINSPATVQGLELELTANPVDALTIDASVGYNRFRAKQKDPAQIDYRHPDALIQPEVNASAGIQYEVGVGAGSLTPRLDWFYTSKMTYGTPIAPPTREDVIPAYSLLNARLTYDSPGREWAAALSVTNLTDKLYYYNFFETVAAGRSGSPSRPREWAITIRRKF